MAYLLIQFTVEDFAKWRRVFDSNDSFRRANGGGTPQVFRDAANPNVVTILSEWDSAENAQRFTGLEQLRQAMKDAGVVGRPEFHILNQA